MAGQNYTVTATTNDENSPDQQYVMGHFQATLKNCLFARSLRHRKMKNAHI